jgi:hypothetical protein
MSIVSAPPLPVSAGVVTLCLSSHTNFNAKGKNYENAIQDIERIIFSLVGNEW